MAQAARWPRLRAAWDLPNPFAATRLGVPGDPCRTTSPSTQPPQEVHSRLESVIPASAAGIQSSDPRAPAPLPFVVSRARVRRRPESNHTLRSPPFVVSRTGVRRRACPEVVDWGISHSSLVIPACPSWGWGLLGSRASGGGFSGCRVAGLGLEASPAGRRHVPPQSPVGRSDREW